MIGDVRGQAPVLSQVNATMTARAHDGRGGRPPGGLGAHGADEGAGVADEVERCGWCGADAAVPILYGYPADDEVAGGDEVVRGGCVIEEDAPSHACRGCGARFVHEPGRCMRSVPRPWRRHVDAAFEVVGTGALPVVVHVPHAGLHIPPEVRDGIVLDDDALRGEQRAITDHRTDALAAGAAEAGARVFVNRLSRLVIDPERFPDPDDEVMAQVGMGPVYVSTTDRGVLRRPTAAQRQGLLDRWFAPYADALADEVDAIVARHGHCVVVDLHSFPSRRLAYELGGEERPEVCVGTDDVHTPEWLARIVEEVASGNGYATARNTPFAGTYVPMRRWGSADVASVMLELRRDLYMDEDPASSGISGAHPWARAAALEPDVAWFVTAVVEAIGVAAGPMAMTHA